MKIALCLSGHFRSFELCYPNLKKYLLDPLQCDIFCQIWDDLKPEQLEKIESLPGLKALRVDQPQYSDAIFIKKVCPYVNPQNALSMWTGIHRAFSLKQMYELKYEFKYDCVIRSRYDLWFLAPLQTDNLFRADCVSLPDNACRLGWLNDQFAFGPSWMMDQYASLDKYASSYAARLVFHPEIFLTHHLEQNHIPVAPTYTLYFIRRESGECLPRYPEFPMSEYFKERENMSIDERAERTLKEW